MRWLCTLLLLGGGACAETDVAKLEAVKKQVCACKDLPCTATAMKALPRPVHASHREQVIARDVLDCVARLEEAAKPAEPAPE